MLHHRSVRLATPQGRSEEVATIPASQASVDPGCRCGAAQSSGATARATLVGVALIAGATGDGRFAMQTIDRNELPLALEGEGVEVRATEVG